MEFDYTMKRLYIASDRGIFPVQQLAGGVWAVGEETPVSGGVLSCKLYPISGLVYALQPGSLQIYDAGFRRRPRLASEPNITIPESLRRERFKVRCEVEVTVHADGTATTKIVKGTGYGALDKAVVDGLQSARYKPAILDGKPVEANMSIIVPIAQGMPD